MYIKSSEYQVIGSPPLYLRGELTHSCLTILIVTIETYRAIIIVVKASCL